MYRNPADIWFLTGDICKIHLGIPNTICCIPSNLTQTHNYDISISPSNVASPSFKLLKLLNGRRIYAMPEVSV